MKPSRFFPNIGIVVVLLIPTVTDTMSTTSGQARVPTPAPIAIVGMGCRLSGDAKSPQSLLAILEQGKSTWSKIPVSRFNVAGTYHPNGQRIGSASFSHVFLFRRASCFSELPDWMAYYVYMYRTQFANV